MSVKRRLICGLCAVLLISVVFAACAPAGATFAPAPTAAKEEPVRPTAPIQEGPVATVNLAAYLASGYEEKMLDKSIEAFRQQNPNIVVKPTYIR